MTCLNCSDDFLLFLYKDLLLAREARSIDKKLPRKTEGTNILDDAGITVIPAENKKEMELKLKLKPKDGDKWLNNLILNTGKQAILDQLFRHLRNAVAHADFHCNEGRDTTVEIFHEYQGTKRLFGSVQQQSLRNLVRLVKEDG